jgi:hypothetical protein
MKRIMFILILCALSASLFCDNLSDYQIEKVKVIPTGKEKGLIGWERSVAGGKSGPTAFVITNYYTYVPDRVNNRLNVYDNNFLYLKSILFDKNDIAIPCATLMKADESGNIIIYINSFGLKKIKADGTEMYTLKYEELPNQVNQFNNFFTIDSDVFIYDDNEEVAYITDKGQIIKSGDALSRLKSIPSVNTTRTMNQAFSLPADKKAVINKFAANSKFMIKDEDYFSSLFYKNEEYFKKIKDVRDYVRAQKQKQAGTAVKDKTTDISLSKWGLNFIGYDNDHNGYWDGIQTISAQGFDKEAIIIFSRYGELLDAFYYGQNDNGKANYALFPTTNAVLAVAPNGDVYFLVGNEKEYAFYKVTRRW